MPVRWTRVAEHAVRALQHQRRREPSAEGEPQRPQAQEEGQQDEGAMEAEDAEEPVREQELGKEAEHVQDDVDVGEEATQLLGRHVRATVLLKT